VGNGMIMYLVRRDRPGVDFVERRNRLSPRLAATNRAAHKLLMTAVRETASRRHALVGNLLAVAYSQIATYQEQPRHD
jgi:hypothetical protein